MTEPPLGSSTVKKMGPVHLGRRPRWMRDRGPARCEPTGYKVRRALARRWQRPSPRNIEHKHIPCRSFLTGSAPCKGGGRRCGGRPGRQVRARCRRAASPSPSAGVGPRGTATRVAQPPCAISWSARKRSRVRRWGAPIASRRRSSGVWPQRTWSTDNMVGQRTSAGRNATPPSYPEPRPKLWASNWTQFNMPN